jgi:hypothetical protein
MTYQGIAAAVWEAGFFDSIFRHNHVHHFKLEKPEDRDEFRPAGGFAVACGQDIRTRQLVLRSTGKHQRYA